MKNTKILGILFASVIVGAVLMPLYGAPTPSDRLYAKAAQKSLGNREYQKAAIAAGKIKDGELLRNVSQELITAVVSSRGGAVAPESAAVEAVELLSNASVPNAELTTVVDAYDARNTLDRGILNAAFGNNRHARVRACFADILPVAQPQSLLGAQPQVPVAPQAPAAPQPQVVAQPQPGKPGTVAEGIRNLKKTGRINNNGTFSRSGFRPLPVPPVNQNNVPPAPQPQVDDQRQTLEQELNARISLGLNHVQPAPRQRIVKATVVKENSQEGNVGSNNQIPTDEERLASLNGYGEEHNENPESDVKESSASESGRESSEVGSPIVAAAAATAAVLEFEDGDLAGVPPPPPPPPAPNAARKSTGSALNPPSLPPNHLLGISESQSLDAAKVLASLDVATAKAGLKKTPQKGKESKGSTPWKNAKAQLKRVPEANLPLDLLRSRQNPTSEESIASKPESLEIDGLESRLKKLSGDIRISLTDADKRFMAGDVNKFVMQSFVDKVAKAFSEYYSASEGQFGLNTKMIRVLNYDWKGHFQKVPESFSNTICQRHIYYILWSSFLNSLHDPMRQIKSVLPKYCDISSSGERTFITEKEDELKSILSKIVSVNVEPNLTFHDLVGKIKTKTNLSDDKISDGLSYMLYDTGEILRSVYEKKKTLLAEREYENYLTTCILVFNRTFLQNRFKKDYGLEGYVECLKNPDKLCHTYIDKLAEDLDRESLTEEMLVGRLKEYRKQDDADFIRFFGKKFDESDITLLGGTTFEYMKLDIITDYRIRQLFRAYIDRYGAQELDELKKAEERNNLVFHSMTNRRAAIDVDDDNDSGDANDSDSDWLD